MEWKIKDKKLEVYKTYDLKSAKHIVAGSNKELRFNKITGAVFETNYQNSN